MLLVLVIFWRTSGASKIGKSIYHRNRFSQEQYHFLFAFVCLKLWTREWLWLFDQRKWAIPKLLEVVVFVECFMSILVNLYVQLTMDKRIVMTFWSKEVGNAKIARGSSSICWMFREHISQSLCTTYSFSSLLVVLSIWVLSNILGITLTLYASVLIRGNAHLVAIRYQVPVPGTRYPRLPVVMHTWDEIEKLIFPCSLNKRCYITFYVGDDIGDQNPPCK